MFMSEQQKHDANIATANNNNKLCLFHISLLLKKKNCFIIFFTFEIFKKLPERSILNLELNQILDHIRIEFIMQFFKIIISNLYYGFI